MPFVCKALLHLLTRPQHLHLLQKIWTPLLAGIILATPVLLKKLPWHGECIAHQKFSTMVGVIHLEKARSQKPATTLKLAAPRNSLDGPAGITKDLPEA